MRKKRCCTTCTQISCSDGKFMMIYSHKKDEQVIVNLSLLLFHSFKTEVPIFCPCIVNVLFKADHLFSSSRGRISIVWVATQVAADWMPVHQMNRCTQQSVHDTTFFNSDRDDNGIGKRTLGFLTFERERHWRQSKASVSKLLVDHSSEFSAPHSSCDTEKLQHPRVSWKWLHPCFFFFFSCRGAVRNDHLSIWSMRTESCCAVARCGGQKVGTAI